MKTRTLKEAYERWIAALRSGEYEQGQGKLYKNGKYCCLGVLLDLRAKDGVGGFVSENGDMMYVNDDGSYPVEKSTTGLPAAFGEQMKIPSNVENYLVQMNDGRVNFLSSSFEDIADYIETEIMPDALQREKQNEN